MYCKKSRLPQEGENQEVLEQLTRGGIDTHKHKEGGKQRREEETDEVDE